MDYNGLMTAIIRRGESPSGYHEEGMQTDKVSDGCGCDCGECTCEECFLLDTYTDELCGKGL